MTDVTFPPTFSPHLNTTIIFFFSLRERSIDLLRLKYWRSDELWHFICQGTTGSSHRVHLLPAHASSLTDPSTHTHRRGTDVHVRRRRIVSIMDELAAGFEIQYKYCCYQVRVRKGERFQGRAGINQGPVWNSEVMLTRLTILMFLAARIIFSRLICKKYGFNRSFSNVKDERTKF